jgi:hypothetical protein
MLAAIEKAELLVAALAAEATCDGDPVLGGVREAFQHFLARGYPPRLALTLALRTELVPVGTSLLVARAG